MFAHINGFKYSKCLNSSIWPIDETLTGTTSRSYGNEEVIHIPQSSWTGASPSDGLVPYPGHLLAVVVEEYLTSLQRCSPLILQPQLTFHLILWVNNQWIQETWVFFSRLKEKKGLNKNFLTNLVHLVIFLSSKAAAHNYQNGTGKKVLPRRKEKKNCKKKYFMVSFIIFMVYQLLTCYLVLKFDSFVNVW